MERGTRSPEEAVDRRGGGPDMAPPSPLIPLGLEPKT